MSTLIMIKKIITFYKLSKKYDFKMRFFFFVKDYGQFGVEEKTGQKYIWVSLFSKYFYPILYHEIGHLVAKRTLNFESKYASASSGKRIFYKNKDSNVVLLEEAMASKFSNRVLKGQYKNYLRKCFHTYSAGIAKHMVKWPEFIDDYIKTIVKCERILK